MQIHKFNLSFHSISNLEIELGTIQTKTGDTHKAFQKADRHIKELQFQGVHDAKLHARRSLEVTQLQDKIKKLKDQLDEAENIAAVNLAKFQKSKKDLEEAERKGKFSGLKVETIIFSLFNQRSSNVDYT